MEVDFNISSIEDNLIIEAGPEGKFCAYVKQPEKSGAVRQILHMCIVQ
jgi:hypothetical protein